MSSDRFLIRQGQKIYFRGIKGIITNTSNPIWITVTDENGMERSIKRSLLVSNPLFKFFQDAIDRNNEKIDEYDEKVAQLNLLRKNSLALQRQKRHEMRAYLSKCGVNLATQLNGQDMSYYNNLRKQYSDLKMTWVSAGNELQGIFSIMLNLIFGNGKLANWQSFNKC